MVTMHNASDIKFVIVLFVVSNYDSFHMYQNAQAMSLASQKCKLLNAGICKPFVVFHLSFKASDQSRDRAFRGFSLLF